VTKNSISGAPKSEETITEQENSAIKPPENKWSVDVFPITHDFSEEEFSKFVEHKWYCVEYYVEGPVKIVASVSLSPASSPTPKIARAGSSFVRCNGTIGVIHNTHSPSLLSKEL